MGESKTKLWEMEDLEAFVILGENNIQKGTKSSINTTTRNIKTNASIKTSNIESENPIFNSNNPPKVTIKESFRDSLELLSQNISEQCENDTDVCTQAISCSKHTQSQKPIDVIFPPTISQSTIPAEKTDMELLKELIAFAEQPIDIIEPNIENSQCSSQDKVQEATATPSRMAVESDTTPSASPKKLEDDREDKEEIVDAIKSVSSSIKKLSKKVTKVAKKVDKKADTGRDIVMDADILHRISEQQIGFMEMHSGFVKEHEQYTKRQNEILKENAKLLYQANKYEDEILTLKDAMKTLTAENQSLKREIESKNRNDLLVLNHNIRTKNPVPFYPTKYISGSPTQSFGQNFVRSMFSSKI